MVEFQWNKGESYSIICNFDGFSNIFKGIFKWNFNLIFFVHIVEFFYFFSLMSRFSGILVCSPACDVPQTINLKIKNVDIFISTSKHIDKKTKSPIL